MLDTFKNFLFVVSPAIKESGGKAIVFLKIRSALMISYAVSNRITNFMAIKK